MSDLPEYVLERTFNAPRALVWRTWTEPELLARWYGPNVETVIHKLDVTPGGLWLNEMRWEGGSSRERMEYTDVRAPERLSWLHSMADDNWEIAGNPQMPNWPRVLLATVVLAEDGAQTQMRFTWSPHEASADETAFFAKAIEGLGRGWNAGMDILETVLDELQA